MMYTTSFPSLSHMESLRTVFQTGSVNASLFRAYVSKYGGIMPDWPRSGLYMGTPLPLFIIGGNGVTISPTDDSEVRIGSAAKTLNIGTAGTRFITIGGENADVTTVGETLRLEGKPLRQFNPIPLTGENATISLTDLMRATPVFYGSPQATPTTLTLPSAHDTVSQISDLTGGDYITITVMNLDDTNTFVLAAGTGGTTRGNMTVSPHTSAFFSIQFNNVTAGAESYTVNRMS